MQICWPPFFFFTKTDGDIVKKGIIPDIGNLCGVERKRNSEFISLTRDRKIIESCFYKLFHFSKSAMGRDKIRMRVIEFDKAILVL